MATKDKTPAPKKPATKTKVTRVTSDSSKKAATPAADAKKPAAKIAKPATAKTTAKTVKPATVKTAKPAAAKAPKAPKTPKMPMEDKDKNVFQAIGGYFAGAWYELKQVSWPNRRSTWSLTAAMLVFTGFFVLVILLLDTLFKYLFEIMLG